ncbi:MAG: autotransporter outer membrane beta-barrel domain-containing protein, partial [Asticcacaulis sp.]|nr:autotransporter outer membrane beta-barrel domain-containing protein [Asticcacaulis sp.]
LFHGDRGYFVQVVGQGASKNKDISQQGQIGTVATTSSQKAYDYTVGGFRAGAVTAINDDAAFGIAFTALNGESKAFLVSAKPTDLSIDVGVDWNHGPAFITAQVGGSLGQYSDYDRQTLIGAFHETRNQIDVSSLSATIQGGLDHHLGGWTVTPVARLAYVSADMKGFAEQGTIAAVSFDGRKVSSFNGAVELRAAGKLSETTGLNAVIGYEAAFSGKEGALKGRLIGNTAQPFSTDMGEVGNPGVLLGVGVTTKLLGLNLSASYRGTFGDDDRSGQSGFVGFTKAF